jgi:hypothetical protein
VLFELFSGSPLSRYLHLSVAEVAKHPERVVEAVRQRIKEPSHREILEAMLKVHSVERPDSSALILHPSPSTLHPSPFTLHPPPSTLHPAPFTLHPSLITLHPAPFTLHHHTTACVS